MVGGCDSGDDGGDDGVVIVKLVSDDEVLIVDVGWLVSWLAGWLLLVVVGWLFGWLVGCWILG